MRRDVSLLVAVGVAVMALGAGCATYTDGVREAKYDVVAHQPNEAVGKLNKALGTEKDSQIPAKLSGKNTLMLLERATLLQALGKYELAARDMMIADQQLDWLDIGAQGKAKIGKYMYSGTSVKYRAPPFERLFLNALNCLNFLAMGDVEEAKVEARRFRLIEQFFVEDESKTLLSGSLGFGNYLGGVAFEAAGDYRKAVRYYARAWKHGVRTDRFKERLGHLLQMTGQDFADLVENEDGSKTEAANFAANTSEPLSWSEYRKRFVDGEVLVIVQTGLVPYKEGKRLPVGAALEIASQSRHSSYHLTHSERRRAMELSTSGALKWVMFPVLTDKGLPPTRDVSIAIDGSEVATELGANVSKQVRHAWDRIKGALMAAAITRMITRAVAGAAARSGTTAASGDSGLGALAQIAVEGGMAAADTPDTRSWSMLPARIRLTRRHLKPGEHTVEISVDGETASKSVDVPESGPAIVNFSGLR